MVTRRHFLRWLLGMPVISSFLLPVPRLFAQIPSLSRKQASLSIGESFAGEIFHYEIDFWFLKRVAIATLSFTGAEEKGHHIITLKGETVGLIGFLSRYRVDTYRAVAEEIDGGRRLRSLSFDEYVKVGKKVRKNIHTFDHEKRVWIQRTIRSSGATSDVEHEIPQGKDYNDFLTAAYNFRYGTYGPIERGRTYTIPTFPRKGKDSYELKIAPKNVEDEVRKSNGVMEESEYLIQVWLDPEIVNSPEGAIEGWLSKEIYPVEGIIKDVFLFGDVHGHLIKREKAIGNP